MCTVSWAKRPDGYTLFFNRDESRNRKPGLPPKNEAIGSTHFMCPLDPEGGGTWILVNEHGLTLGILNYYEAQLYYHPKEPQSRGKLPKWLAPCATRDEAENAILEKDLSPYPPFHLLVVDRETQASLITWDGKSKAISHPGNKDLPISTSSYETIEVVGQRKQLFRETVLAHLDDDRALEAFHISKQPPPETHAVFMTRTNAKTVSVIRISVDTSRAEMHYRNRPDDSEFLEPPVINTLDLK